MWKKVLLLLLLLTIAMAGRIWWDQQSGRNDVSIALTDPSVPGAQRNVAVVGDVHLQDTPAAFGAFRLTLDEIRQADPDLVLFVGDYTENPGRVENMDRQRTLFVTFGLGTSLLPIRFFAPSQWDFLDVNWN